MLNYFHRQNSMSFRNASLLIMSAIALPFLFVIILFEWNTAQIYQASISTSRHSTLSAYGNAFDNSINIAQNHIIDTAANNLSFQMFLYANTKTESFIAAQELENNGKPLLQSNSLLGSIYLYSEQFNYFHIINITNYPRNDQDIIKNKILEFSQSGQTSDLWIPVALNNRTVLLYTFVNRGTVFSALIDPARQSYVDLETNSKVFLTNAEGIPFTPETAFGNSSLPSPDQWNKIYTDETGIQYDLIYQPLHSIAGYIVYAIPHKAFFEQLNVMQFLLMIIIFCLLVSIPICWMLLRNFLLRPLASLTETTQKIKEGSTDTRVPQNSNIYEVNAIAETVNTMLDTIVQQKITTYEQQLYVRDLRLQYLQLQLRPHFFLNCLNLIYSLAEERKYDELQELTLNLSVYLRSIFKDGSKLVTLASEVRSVECFIRIQESGNSFPPQLQLFIDSDTTEFMIPSISILTFVENSIKHSKLRNSSLHIKIKSGLLSSEEGNYLNISIYDNGGGFTPEILAELNALDGHPAADGHIGISNIRHRLYYIYGEKATLTFQNRSGGACVDLFIPLNNQLEVTYHESSIS